MAASVRLAELPWESRFVEALPGDQVSDNYTRHVPQACYSRVMPTPVASPKLLAWSDDLAKMLGVKRPDSSAGECADGCANGCDKEAVEILAGNLVLPSMKPYAARYGGHQFGHWAGQLGDGRAITIGEVSTLLGGRQEFQLKGAGPTPYSRRADGRAVLRSSLREFLCSEAMHHLGIPTTRALSLVATGDSVVRDMFYDGNPKPEPGAIVCRVAPSFARFGNFEIFAASGEISLLKNYFHFILREHFPSIDPDHSASVGTFFSEVCRRTAHLMVDWMRVGFVHGVMNTDNMSILGLTIDYGPYGWLEPFDPNWTPNTTDAQGRRYCYGNQPSVALWNLARLAEALLPLLASDAFEGDAASSGQRREAAEEVFQAGLASYRSTFEDSFERALLAKLGLGEGQGQETGELVNALLRIFPMAEVDFTLFFRILTDVQGKFALGTESALTEIYAELQNAFYHPDDIPSDVRSAWQAWLKRYAGAMENNSVAPALRQQAMRQVNPNFILRNYLVQEAIEAAEEGELGPTEKLYKALQSPFSEASEGGLDPALLAKRPEWARYAPGCSALSCSS